MATRINELMANLSPERRKKVEERVEELRKEMDASEKYFIETGKYFHDLSPLMWSDRTERITRCMAELEHERSFRHTDRIDNPVLHQLWELDQLSELHRLLYEETEC